MDNRVWLIVFLLVIGMLYPATGFSQSADSLKTERKNPNTVPYETGRSIGYHVLAVPSYLLHWVSHPVGLGVKYAEDKFPHWFEGKRGPYGFFSLVEIGSEEGFAAGVLLYHDHLFFKDHRARAEILFGSPLEPSLAVLRKKLQKTGDNSATIFLGDNAYPNGLPEKEHRHRLRAEKRLQAQFKSVKNCEGQIVFIAGNHDWNSSRRGGLQAVRRQEQFVEQSLNQGNVFLPDSGQPGPEVVKVENGNFNMSIIALNTQWWLHSHTQPGAETDAEKEATKEQVIQNLRKAVTDTTADQVLVAGHHPMYSNGIHGGKFPLKTHLFPPVAGSVYILYRKIWGTPKDITSSDYSEFKERVTSVFAERDPLIYASGHEHSLQYITFDDERSNQHYLISGSSTVTSYVKPPELPNFGIQQKGFAAVHYYENSIWVEFWSEGGKHLYEKQINIIYKNNKGKNL